MSPSEQARFLALIAESKPLDLEPRYYRRPGHHLGTKPASPTLYQGHIDGARRGFLEYARSRRHVEACGDPLLSLRFAQKVANHLEANDQAFMAATKLSIPDKELVAIVVSETVYRMYTGNEPSRHDLPLHECLDLVEGAASHQFHSPQSIPEIPRGAFLQGDELQSALENCRNGVKFAKISFVMKSALEAKPLQAEEKTWQDIFLAFPEIQAAKKKKLSRIPGEISEGTLYKSYEELFHPDGSWKDPDNEEDYQKYCKRKEKLDQEPRDRLEWKLASDYTKLHSPMARGNKFDNSRISAYPMNQVHLGNDCRLDSYNPFKKPPEIVSRKATDLDDIDKYQFKSFLNEMKDKYAPGTPINSPKNGMPSEAKEVLALDGQMILEIPDTNRNSRKLAEFKKMAQAEGIVIRLAPE